MGGDGKDSLRGRMKPRVLCLHGFRTRGSILQQQIGRWDKSVLERLDLCFLDAPFPAQGKSDVEGYYPPPYYEWFQFNAGAHLSAGLAGLQSKGLALTKVPPIQFVIVVSGAKFKPLQLQKAAYSSPIKCPSLHFLEIVEELLRREPDLAKQRDNSYGRTALHIAASDCSCPRKILTTLLKIDNSMCLISDQINLQTALHLAAIHGKKDAVKCILKSERMSAEIADKDGKTALHLAVQNGRLQVVRELLPAMSRFINVADGSGHTPFDIAVQKLIKEKIRYVSR